MLLPPVWSAGIRVPPDTGVDVLASVEELELSCVLDGCTGRMVMVGRRMTLG